MIANLRRGLAELDALLPKTPENERAQAALTELRFSLSRSGRRDPRSLTERKRPGQSWPRRHTG